jgi:hypothetical protein
MRTKFDKTWQADISSYKMGAAMAWAVPGQTMICDWSLVLRKCLVTSGGSLDKKMVCSLLASSADWPQHHALFSTLLHVCVQNWMTSPHNHVLQTDWRMQLELLSGELPESGEVGRGGRQSTGPGPQECGPCGRTGPQIFRGPYFPIFYYIGYTSECVK